MAKKIKPVAETKNSENDQTILGQLEVEAPVLGSAQAFNNKVKAELARLETVEAENLRLNNENQDLTARIAQYLDEIDKLKIQLESKQSTGSVNDNSSELKSLRDENDKYLMKISELTFENAKLEAQLQSKSSATNAPNTSENPGMKLAARHRNIYRNSAALNGYSAWN